MAASSPDFDACFQAQFEALLRWRRDVRRFLDKPVDAQVIDRVLALADLSPSVGNSQPWRVVRVRSDHRRMEVARVFEEANAAALAGYGAHTDRGLMYAGLKLAGLREAPVHLAVFSESGPVQGQGLGRATMPETLAYSTVGMIQTLWLSARMLGLGVGWVSILKPDRLTEILEVDPAWQFIAYLCVGYPEEEHTDPELERAGWQERTPMDTRILDR
ncbi:5,6-dimethylbenzimidazole synthase [Roseibium aquae]|uniref:5,6-dimethylbenzimidazole synthase n=1 Tax=Roseibium aquae TaxID=1323746 RepID=A0A916WW87_9HYPH|nr:5,6-dimethylbenzimidazole synthase [Roseibium aquae]GGB34909.1 5,6-dimethylbenzimidazole synthase [Roseibium aquae]